MRVPIPFHRRQRASKWRGALRPTTGRPPYASIALSTPSQDTRDERLRDGPHAPGVILQEPLRKETPDPPSFVDGHDSVDR